MINKIQLEKSFIGEGYKPFIIAEMSGNHNQSLERAIEIIDAAHLAGASAIKLQTYTADTLTLKGAHKIEDPKSLWYGKELHDLYREAYTPWEWHETLFKYARSKGLMIFSSPFDETAVDFLEDLNVSAYKIASFENTHHPLLKKVAKTGKPVIMSTGISSLADIDTSVRLIRKEGCKELILLKCTSTYPASPENTNLLTIPHMRDMFGCHVGLSDHTMGIGAAIAAVAMGARVIEKHFTLKRSDGGVDAAFSIEPEELKALVIESERAFLALGKISYGIGDVEQKNIQFKRSIYVSEEIKSGEAFTAENIRIVRPGFGLPPEYYEELLGKKATKNLKSGAPLTWTDLF